MSVENDPLVREFDALRRRASASTLVHAHGRSWTVEEIGGLERRFLERLNEDLAPEGPVAGHVVGLRMANGPGFLAALVALRRAGLVALLLDARSPAEESRRTAARFSATALWSGAPTDADQAPPLERLPGAETVPSTRRTIGVIKLTSGSTGDPLGVAVSTDALLADDVALRATMAITDDDRFLAAIPFSHSYGLSSLVVPALVRGNPLLLVADGVTFDPLDATAALEPTVFPTVPAYLAAHLRRDVPQPLPRSLRLVVSAGAPLPPAVAVRFREVHDQGVHVFYGASETGGISYDRDGTAGERGTLGTAVDGVAIELDVRDGAPRVAVRSDAVAERYLPVADDRLAGGRYLTEDLGAFEGEELRLTGRLGDRINVRGKKVDPREIEAVLGRHAAVEDVRVVGIPRASSGDETIRAVVACRSDGVSLEELTEWCRRHLAAFKVPRSFRIVDSIPTDARGKLDRTTLRRLADEGPRP